MRLSTAAGVSTRPQPGMAPGWGPTPSACLRVAVAVALPPPTASICHQLSPSATNCHRNGPTTHGAQHCEPGCGAGQGGASLLLRRLSPFLQIPCGAGIDLVLVLCSSLGHDLKDILIIQRMIFPHTLRTMLCTCSPNHGVFELVQEVLVQPLAQVLHRIPFSHNEGLLELRWVTLLLCVDTDQLQLFPDLLDHEIEIQVPLAADHEGVWQTCQPVNLLDSYGVHLVVDVQGRQVLTVALHHVDEVVDRRVLADQDLGIVDLIPMQDVLAQLLIEVCCLNSCCVVDDVHR
mmetsp:Transcript_11229/g.20230  ORF Transcript_11229/g.20230 Transcript_11229/m.20230 type:complete len:290 (-) Transcript_11229:623-1492(-)